MRTLKLHLRPCMGSVLTGKTMIDRSLRTLFWLEQGDSSWGFWNSHFTVHRWAEPWKMCPLWRGHERSKNSFLTAPPHFLLDTEKSRNDCMKASMMGRCTYHLLSPWLSVFIDSDKVERKPENAPLDPREGQEGNWEINAQFLSGHLCELVWIWNAHLNPRPQPTKRF